MQPADDMRIAQPPRLERLRFPLGAVLVCANSLLGGCDNQQPDRSQNTADSATLPDAPWFTEITPQSVLDVVYETGGQGRLYLPEIMGGGSALFDFDNDGDLDIYVLNGNYELPNKVQASMPQNRLFRQEEDGRFVDVTERSGLGDGGYGMGVALGDLDNDGHIDVFVSNYGPDAMFRNRGDGTFEDITEKAGVSIDGWSCSALFFDFDLDGFLDLYVTQYIDYDPQNSCSDAAGRPDYCSPLVGAPVHDVLLHNNGDGTFTDVSLETQIASGRGPGLGVVSEDLNDDGWPDLYVANDGFDNHLWINEGGKTFRNDGLVMGVAYNQHGSTEAGMGVIAADIDNDTDMDLFVTHLGGQTNTLYRNMGGELGFRDTTGSCGLGASSLPYTGFGTGAFDVELDGDLDIFVVNGRVVRGDPIPGANALAPWNIFVEPNLLYINDGTGRFDLLSDKAGELCSRMEITRGAAFGDVDADGDLDVLVSNIEGPARLYRNDAPRKGHWLAVRAIDPQLKRDVFGAGVTVTVTDQKFVRTITSAFSYLSASEPVAHFGLGEADRVDQIEVLWPGGKRERFAGVPVDKSVQLLRGRGVALP